MTEAEIAQVGAIVVAKIETLLDKTHWPKQGGGS